MAWLFYALYGVDRRVSTQGNCPEPPGRAGRDLVRGCDRGGPVYCYSGACRDLRRSVAWNRGRRGSHVSGEEKYG